MDVELETGAGATVEPAPRRRLRRHAVAGVVVLCVLAGGALRLVPAGTAAEPAPAGGASAPGSTACAAS
jgi:hypothetical protein